MDWLEAYAEEMRERLVEDKGAAYTLVQEKLAAALHSPRCTLAELTEIVDEFQTTPAREYTNNPTA